MFASSSVAHYSFIHVIVLLVMTVIVALSLRSAMSMKLTVRFIGRNRFADDGHSLNGTAADDYFNRRYFDIKNDLISHDDGDEFNRGQMPSIKMYTKEDVVQCFDLLSSSRQSGNQRPMHFAFVGDSTVRQHFVSFLKWIPDYDRRTTASNASAFAEYYFHEDRNLTSALQNSLRVSFYWRDLIREEVLADFERWSSASNPTSPDFILLGITAHHVGTNDVSPDLETFVSLLEGELLPLIKKSLAAHPQQKIVWLHQSRTVEEMTPDFYDIYADDIDKYNKEIRRVFRGTGVIIWDSINAIVEENVRACDLTAFERRDRKMYLSCYDFIHPGFRAVSLGGQLIFNHLCKIDDVY
ncbi:uncharacterized protein LOC130689121 [Daphnia carinata]|uniref:uncharacterized protein LOC130689121 n=1 Tax=Daphnia carinata TaxID=120202 RepID=UPI00257CF9F7|nr:uncharacterized protein LOC130689121 [Daphnia carinata]